LGISREQSTQVPPERLIPAVELQTQKLPLRIKGLAQLAQLVSEVQLVQLDTHDEHAPPVKKWSAVHEVQDTVVPEILQV
jgi:hypothetical protein